MKNTKTEYTSDQRTPVVLPEMEQLLPPLSAEQFSSLERDILESGCYAPIIVNEELVIVDGHNRFRICEKHGLPFRMLVFSFADLLEAKQWALETQRGRRNLSLWALGQIALKLKPELETAAKAHQGRRTDLSVNSPKSHTPFDTRKEMAQAVGIGEQAMGRIARLSEDAPQALKDALERKEVSVNRGWKILKALQQLSEEERENAVTGMISAVREIIRIDAEADQRGKIASLFCKAYERAILLTPTSENIRCWVEGTRMRPEEIEDTIKESYDLAQVFHTIGDILKLEFLPHQ
ncbi:ParB/RepB/Spo0J family partition protein [uncultured Oscillibacter sp.]|uniref:ParB/RepB/Spo0J family partition protein n=1 Tax=uncultured Oscillibacter sp. TaxID=876091 RepID=UPI0025E210DE|nr:ParB/RepB/Spo0J family partition protein [uncultured Oscillibacter sp.]